MSQKQSGFGEPVPGNAAIDDVPAGYDTKAPKLMGHMAADEGFLWAWLRRGLGRGGSRYLPRHAVRLAKIGAIMVLPD